MIISSFASKGGAALDVGGLAVGGQWEGRRNRQGGKSEKCS